MSGLFCLTASCNGKVWVTHDLRSLLGFAMSKPFSVKKLKTSLCACASFFRCAKTILSVLLIVGAWLGSVSWAWNGTRQFGLRTKALVALTPGCIVWHWETPSQKSMEQKHPTQERNAGFAYTTNDVDTLRIGGSTSWQIVPTIWGHGIFFRLSICFALRAASQACLASLSWLALRAKRRSYFGGCGFGCVVPTSLEVFDPAWSKEEFTMTAVTLDNDQSMTPSDASQLCSSCNDCCATEVYLIGFETASSSVLHKIHQGDGQYQHS